MVVNPLTGAYTVELLTNVLHESLNGLEGDDTENDATVVLTFTVKDADNSSADGTLTITFDDDSPTVTVNAEVSETEMAALTTMVDETVGGERLASYNFV